MPGERLKRLIRRVAPPIVLDVARWVRTRGSAPVAVETPRLAYAPDGWDTVLPDGVTGWNRDQVATEEAAKWDAFLARAAGAGPLGFSHEAADLQQVRNVSFHNLHLTFAYVLARAARRRERVSILDWGGALGHYHAIARATLPEVPLEYHCHDLPLLVERGRALNPDIHWHSDAGCLARSYDLVMVSGSLQCMRDWRAFLPRAAGAVGPDGFLLLTRVPVVEGPSFVAIQRVYGGAMFHQQFNRAELLAAVTQTGLTLARELVVGDRPRIANAPEQCELTGWLFERPA